MTILTDDKLLQRWRRHRDADAFTELVARYGRMVFATSSRVLGNPTDAEDVTQDCFLRLAMANASNLPFLGPWLHRMATHRALDRLRGNERRRRREQNFVEEMERNSPNNPWGEFEPFVDEAVASLPDELRVLVVRHFLEGCPYSVLAESMGVPKSTVARRVQTGINRIRAALHIRGAAATNVSCLTFLYGLRQRADAMPASLVSHLGKMAISGGLGGVKPILAGGSLLMAKKIAIGAVILAVGAGVLFLTPMSSRFLKYFRTPVAERSEDRVPPSTRQATSQRTTDKNAPVNVNKVQKTTKIAGTEEPILDQPVDWPALLMAALRKKGEKTELQPIKSADLPADNGMHYFLLAAELWPDIDEDRLRELVKMLRAGQLIDDAELLALLEKCKPSLDAIRQGLEVGNCRIPPPRGFDEPFPYLSKFRAMSRLMNLNAQRMVAIGDYAGALDEYATLLNFGNESSRGACLIGRLVGNAMVLGCTEDIRTIALEGGGSPELYRGFLGQLQALDSNICPVSETLGVEIDATCNWFENNIGNVEAFRALMANPDMGFDESIRQMVAQSTPEQVQAQVLQFVNKYQALGQYLAEPYYQFQQLSLEQFTDDPLSREIFDAMMRIPAAEARAGAERQSIALTVALELYHTEQGEWPDSLNALAPDYLSSVPKDPFTGESFIYKPTGEGFTLYSVGANMRDDGGGKDQWDAEDGDLLLVDTTRP